MGYGVQIQGYFEVGPLVTLLVGAGAQWIEDHEADKVAMTESKDGMLFFVGIGVHLLFGD